MALELHCDAILDDFLSSKSLKKTIKIQRSIPLFRSPGAPSKVENYSFINKTNVFEDRPFAAGEPPRSILAAQIHHQWNLKCKKIK